MKSKTKEPSKQPKICCNCKKEITGWDYYTAKDEENKYICVKLPKEYMSSAYQRKEPPLTLPSFSGVGMDKTHSEVYDEKHNTSPSSESSPKILTAIDIHRSILDDSTSSLVGIEKFISVPALKAIIDKIPEANEFDRNKFSVRNGFIKLISKEELKRRLGLK